MESKLNKLEIAITSECNIKCKHCYQSDRKQQLVFLSVNHIKNILNDSIKLGVEEIIITGGEPLLHRDFNEIISLIGKYSINTILFTNGLLISDPMIELFLKNKVKEVQVSLDGFKKTHENIRGSKTFDKTIANIKKLKNANIKVSVNSQVSKELLNELELWILFVDSLSIDNLYLTITGSIGEASKNSILSPNEVLSKFNEISSRIGMGNRNCYNKCDALIGRLAINYDGTVFPCDFFKSQSFYSLGNIHCDSLQNIYFNWINSNNELVNYIENSNEVCTKCEHHEYCMPCAARVFTINKNFKSPDKLNCIQFEKEIINQDENISNIIVGLNK